MILAAIDPGKRGAIVVVDTESERAWYEKLTYSSDGLLLTKLEDNLRGVDKVLIEKIKGRGGWGANATFAMGFYFGQIVHELVTSRRMFEYVLPECWTGIVHRDVDLIKGENGAKQKSLRAYKMYFPHDPIGKSRGKKALKNGYHDGIMDALLIASYELLKDNEPLPAWKFEDVEEFKQCS